MPGEVPYMDLGGEQTDSVEEMKALALNEFRQYPLDDFPVFDRIGETLNLKKRNDAGLPPV